MARDAYNFLERQIKWHVDNAKAAKEEAKVANEEAMKEYIANIHTTKEYQRFSAYWRNFTYAEVLGRAEELNLDYNLAELRSEFVDEVPQTPTERNGLRRK